MTEQLGIDDALVADAIAASTRPTIAPVELVHVPDHAYVKGPKGARGCKAPTSTGKPCGKARPDPLHHVPTMNETLTMDWTVYQGAKKKWQPWLFDQLIGSGLPPGLQSVLVEGVMTFPTRARRDQGNHRAFIEKALGDALCVRSCSRCGDPVDGAACEAHPSAEVVPGWIEDDDWSRYEFGNLQMRYAKGERETRLRLLPNAVAPLA